MYEVGLFFERLLWLDSFFFFIVPQKFYLHSQIDLELLRIVHSRDSFSFPFFSFSQPFFVETVLDICSNV